MTAIELQLTYETPEGKAMIQNSQGEWVGFPDLPADALDFLNICPTDDEPDIRLMGFDYFELVEPEDWNKHDNG